MIYIRKPADIPDGIYEGRWSGYFIRWYMGAAEATTTVSTGIRGRDVPVTFEVKNNRVVESSIQKIK